MTRENVGIALNAMADADVCEQIAKGDLSALGDIELDDKERTAVIAAAEDYPEVAGFSESFSFNFSASPPKTTDFAAMGRFGEVAHYAYGKQAGSPAPLGVLIM